MRTNFSLLGIIQLLFFLSIEALYSAPHQVDSLYSDSFIDRVPERLDSIVVEAFRATKQTPITHSSIGEKEMESNSPTSSLPMVLSTLPSVVSTEGSNGLGYSSIRIRGSDPTRINVSLNGITLNDGESQQLFWINLPSLQGALQDIEVTRGVGTSISGTGSFGGSINLRTKFLSATPYGGAEISLGSYNSFISSFEVGTGRSKSGFSFDLRFTRGGGDGYIRNGFSKLNSLYSTLGWYRNNHSIKLNYLFGDQVTGITWEGISKEQERKDRKFNGAGLYYDEAGNKRYWDNESDNYQQHHLQLHYAALFSKSFKFATTLHFTRGYGYYNNYIWDKKYSRYGLEPQEIDGVIFDRSDFIIRQALANYYGAINSTLTYSNNLIDNITGVTLSHHDGDHFGEVDWIKNSASSFTGHRWYLNGGSKWDFSLFNRLEARLVKRSTLFLDLQYRGVAFSLDGLDKDFVSLDWEDNYHFFNPKIGATYNPTDALQLYLSLSVGSKEPGRSDIKESIKAGEPDKILAESMVDYEAGLRYRGEKFYFEGNLYYMDYYNQLIPTGRISETGYTIKENVKESYRAGIELATGWRIIPSLLLDGNLTVSRNRIKNFTQYVDLFDENWSSLGQEELYFKEVTIGFSPSLIAMAQLSWDIGKEFSTNLMTKWVGSQYLDNRADRDNMIPSYSVTSLSIQKGFNMGMGRQFELSLFINNLFNHRYYSDGWSYFAHFDNGTTHLEEGIYPQPGRNFMLKLKFKFD